MELLAPAGNLEKLKWAAIYGADAVYFGTEFGSLRSFAGNFSFYDAEEGINYLHKLRKKAYVTLNIYPFSDEFEYLIETAKKMDDMGADAFIVADLGVLRELKNLGLNADLFISTQANTTNYQAALTYEKLGASRIILARELSLDKIKEIVRKTKGIIETEVFIHGAVCFSYSGRCAISDYLTGHRANRGECKHPCRWRYSIVEETRPGKYMPVFEDERGLYLFNSRDLALFEYVPSLKEAGVDSIKIEGRMKSIHYIATVVSFYRQLLDGKKFSKEKGLELLCRVPNRGFSTGFMKG
jgi:putative protease